MSSMVLKYHTVPPERIAAATLRDLSACDIPSRALGRVSAAFRVTFVGCAAVNEHARSYLLEALGGTADGTDDFDDALSLSEASLAGRSSAARRCFLFGSRPGRRALRDAPTQALPMPLRSALARAAHGAIDAAEGYRGGRHRCCSCFGDRARPTRRGRRRAARGRAPPNPCDPPRRAPGGIV